MKLKYKHIFFDLDGTLWDFHKNASETLALLHKKYNLQSLNVQCDKFIVAFHTLNEQLWQQFSESKISKESLRESRFPTLFRQFDIEDDELVGKVSEDYLKSCSKMPHLIPDTMEMLEYLYDKYTLHIITNGFGDIAYNKLKHSGISKYFRFVITPDIAQSKKPDTGIFEYAINETGAMVTNSVMVGNDALADISGARDFGMDQIYFNPSNVPMTIQPTFTTAALRQLKTIL